MKRNPTFFLILALGALIISACGAAAPAQATEPTQASGSANSAEVVFSGNIEAINGDQMTVAGQTFSMAASGGAQNFQVGQFVRVQAMVDAQGQIQARQVEAVNAPNQPPAVALAQPTADPAAGASTLPEAAPTLPPTPVSAAPADIMPFEFIGNVESIIGFNYTVSGKLFIATDQTIYLSPVLPGDLVNVHYLVNQDGTLNLLQIGPASAPLVTNGGSGTTITGGTTSGGGSLGGSTTTGGGTTGGGTTTSGGSSGDDDKGDDDKGDDD